MGYLVTARKWRPRTFDEVVGQEHITQTIKNAILKNRIAHAYLFAGPRGVGKTTTARILAKSLNCLNLKDGEPCNNCDMCNAFLHNQTMDIIEIDGASNRRIEEIRSLRESVKYAPTRGKYKIYIIDEVHMLTTESFNALLKTLEEPPEHTIFVFATTDVHKVPLTIISRCQRFDFRRIELQNIIGLLTKIAKSEKIKIDDQSLMLIAKKADGALRDAQSLFDQMISFCGENIESSVVAKTLNLIDDEVFFEISNSILDKNFKAAFDVSQKIYENGWNYIDFVNGLIEHFRNIMIVVVRNTTDLIESAEVYKEQYQKYGSSFSEGDLLRILSFLNQVAYELKLTQNQKLKTEISLCHLIGLEKSSTISDIIKKFENVDNIKTTLKKPEAGSSNSLNYSDPDLKSKSFSILPETTVEEPKLKVEPFKMPVINSSEDFKSIIDKWEYFVEHVNSEKFTLGSLLSHMTPVELKGNKLDISTEDSDDEKIFSNYKDFFKKKTSEIFGKPLEFNIRESKTGETYELPLNNLEGIKPPDNSQQRSANKKNSKLIEAIISELGGKEIK